MQQNQWDGVFLPSTHPSSLPKKKKNTGKLAFTHNATSALTVQSEIQVCCRASSSSGLRPGAEDEEGWESSLPSKTAPPNVLLFFLFPNLKSSDLNDSDSGDITWRRFSGLRTAPLERQAAFRMVFCTALNRPTPPNAAEAQVYRRSARVGAGLDSLSQESELKCSHLGFTAGLCSGGGKWCGATGSSCPAAGLASFYAGELAKKHD